LPRWLDVGRPRPGTAAINRTRDNQHATTGTTSIPNHRAARPQGRAAFSGRAYARKPDIAGFIVGYAGAAAVPAGPATVVDQEPRRRYVKDLIRAGKFVKSDGDGGTIDMTVTPGMLAHWAEQFSAMKAAGVKIPMPVGHTSDAEANRGYVLDMWVEGDALMGTVELVGEDGIKLASRAEVSIYSPSVVVAGEKQYPRAIEHVAIVTDPVIPDQGGFVAIAASRGGGSVKVPVYRMARAEDDDSKEPNVEHWKQLAAALGVNLPADADEAKAVELCLGRAKAVMASRAEAEKDKTALAAARGKIAELEKGTAPAAPHPQVIKLSRENRTMKIDGLVKAARITAPVRDRILPALMPKDDGEFARTLSAETDALIDTVIAALGENDPVELAKVKTGPQFAASRTAPGDDQPKFDPAQVELRLDAIGVPKLRS